MTEPPSRPCPGLMTQVFKYRADYKCVDCFPYTQELEKDTTEKVAELFQEIDNYLFASENYKQSNESATLSLELQQECDLWKQRYPHLRYFNADESQRNLSTSFSLIEQGGG